MTELPKIRSLRRLRLVSPAGMIVIAAAMALSFSVLHLCGARQDVSALLATSGGDSSAIIRGGLYTVSYLCFVIVVPVLIIAAGIFAGIMRIGNFRRRRWANCTGDTTENSKDSRS